MNTKDATGLLKLNNYLTGIIVTSGVLYLLCQQRPISNDSNETISILFGVLELDQEKQGKLPMKLMNKTDN